MSLVWGPVVWVCNFFYVFENLRISSVNIVDRSSAKAIYKREFGEYFTAATLLRSFLFFLRFYRFITTNKSQKPKTKWDAHRFLCLDWWCWSFVQSHNGYKNRFATKSSSKIWKQKLKKPSAQCFTCRTSSRVTSLWRKSFMLISWGRVLTDSSVDETNFFLRFVMIWHIYLSLWNWTSHKLSISIRPKALNKLEKIQTMSIIFPLNKQHYLFVRLYVEFEQTCNCFVSFIYVIYVTFIRTIANFGRAMLQMKYTYHGIFQHVNWQDECLPS